MLCYAAIMLRPAVSPLSPGIGLALERRLLGRLWKFGAPGGLQWLVECGSFTLFITLVGGLGKIDQAGTMLAFNVNSVAWVPMMGVGLAVSTMVGQQLGANRPDMAARATWTAFLLAMIYMCTMSLFYVTVPDWFLMGHAAGMAPEQFGPLRDVIVVLLRFVAVYCLFDAMNVVFMSAIRGAGDTRFVFWTVAGHVASAAGPGLAGHSLSRPGPALVLDADHALGLLRRTDLPRAFPARQVADDAGHRAGDRPPLISYLRGRVFAIRPGTCPKHCPLPCRQGG